MCFERRKLKIVVNVCKENSFRTISLSINDYEPILLYEAECTHEIQVRTTQESSVYKATTGRIILAHYSSKELNYFTGKYGLPNKESWPEIKNTQNLVAALTEIRTKEVEIVSNANHVVSLATPIYKNKTIVASLGIYLPDIRFDEITKIKIVEKLKETTFLLNKAIEEQESTYLRYQVAY